MARQYPGLWKDSKELRIALAGLRPRLSGGVEVIIDDAWRYCMTGKSNTHQKEVFEVINRLEDLSIPCKTARDSVQIASQMYATLETGHYQSVAPMYYMGRLHLQEAEQVIIKRRDEVKEQFVTALAAMLPELTNQDNSELVNENAPSSRPAMEEGVAMFLPAEKEEGGEGKHNAEDNAQSLLMVDIEADIPEAMQSLIKDIVDDLGGIPKDYISAAQGMAGNGDVPPETSSPENGSSLVAPITYDEWDYRRAGFRKDWCILLEKDVAAVKGTFVDHTLLKYRGEILQLRKQFEMLQVKDRFVRRQRDGNDIDLDATIESYTDQLAGLPPSDRLFVRLQRDERDIAVMFLVDMSASTEGWVMNALKESLILIGEALHVLGDRYAVYGFSGMRRSRTDFYRIKEFEEPYNPEIKNRIMGISPREYTRMGPALRHASHLLGEMEAKVRLLIVLSDGKPEDYDDYKGEYAIEDTRHALIEAKNRGIHPFCITIDKKAHDYMPHMYGEVNYIFVDNVSKLPVRMPAIYRNLTT